MKTGPSVTLFVAVLMGIFIWPICRQFTWCPLKVMTTLRVFRWHYSGFSMSYSSVTSPWEQRNSQNLLGMEHWSSSTRFATIVKSLKLVCNKNDLPNMSRFYTVRFEGIFHEAVIWATLNNKNIFSTILIIWIVLGSGVAI